MCIGMPKNSVVKYETALKSDKFLLIAHGAADEVAKAKSILETSGASEIAAHHGDWQLNLPVVRVTGVAGRARSRPVILAICRFGAMRRLYRLVNRIVFSE